MTPLSYRKYLLTVLLVLLAFNNLDRLALGLLLQQIKVSLNLSDTQLGLLTGIAFFLFYSVMGIPIARWADRGNRVAIISITAALSSIAVALCGMAATFLQLLVIRIGVAVGEAGSVPPSHSLLADYFPRDERPRAMAIYKMGIPLSLVVGYFCAGWLNELYGWRMTFVWLGLPGLAVAAAAGLTLGDPRSRRPELGGAEGFKPAAGAASKDALAPHKPTLREVGTVLCRNRTFRHLLLGYSVAAFFAAGIGQWKPTFFVRTYGLHSGELGTWFAAIAGGGGLLGTYLGGVLASRYASLNESLQLRSMARLYGCFSVLSVCLYLSPNAYLAFALTGVTFVGFGIVIGPLFATIQTLVAPQMRALSIAILLLVSNLVGLGAGPLAAGALSDALRPWLGEESLRYALVSLCPGYLWCGWHFWQASRTVARDLAVTLAGEAG